MLLPLLRLHSAIAFVSRPFLPISIEGRFFVVAALLAVLFAGCRTPSSQLHSQGMSAPPPGRAEHAGVIATRQTASEAAHSSSTVRLASATDTDSEELTEPATAATVAPAHLEPANPSASVHSLGLAELEQLALQHNPTLVQATAQINISDGKALQAGLYPNPTVGTDSEQMGLRGRGAALGERQGIFMQQEFVTAGKLSLSRAKYQQETQQAQLQALAQQYRILNGIRMAFYDVLAEQRLIEVHGELLTNAEAAVKTTEELINVGQANRSDLLQARIEARRTRVEVKTAENNHRKAWEHLITLVGLPELALAPLEGTLEPDTAPLEWEPALARLLQESPELGLAHAEVARDQITLQREQVEAIPNINVRAGTGYNFENRATTADASVFVRVPVFDRNQGTIHQARWELARACADITRMELSLRKRLAEVFARYQNALVSVEDYHKETLPEAREAYELQLDQFNKRRQAWPAVLVAERTFQQMSVESVKTLLELRHAEVEINGLLLVDGLESPPGPRPGGHIEATPKPR